MQNVLKSALLSFHTQRQKPKNLILMADCWQPKLRQLPGADTWLHTNLTNTFRWQLICRNHYTFTSPTQERTLKQVQGQEGHSFPFCRGFYFVLKRADTTRAWRATAAGAAQAAPCREPRPAAGGARPQLPLTEWCSSLCTPSWLSQLILTSRSG